MALKSRRMNNNALSQLHTFTSKLVYQLQQLEINRQDQSLVLADSLLLHALMRPQLDSLPTQVVVIGPTQSGKSTVVNLLLGSEAAVPSPLAGYTRHAQGFSTAELSAETIAHTDSLLPWLQRSQDGTLSHENLEAFTLKTVEGGPHSLPQLTVWDTPDFDSVSSRGYRDTVPQVCAMADAIIMVVSREKYADQSVWKLLELLAPTGKPLTLLVNKLQAANREALLEAVGEKLSTHDTKNIAIAALPQLDLDTPAALFKAPEAADVAQSLRHWATSQAREDNSQAVAAYLNTHWPSWIAPVKQELNALERWQREVTDAIAELDDHYQDEYLDGTDHSDALQRAMARLLELLEVPAVAGTLGRLRSVVTWPARQLGKFVKEQKSDALATSDIEQETLARLTEHVLLKLRQRAQQLSDSSDKQAAAWWAAMEASLAKQQTMRITQNQDRIDAHQTAFEPEIETAAQSLYTHLQDHPATLNGLRAARISTDAAAVVLAIKSAGLGVSDLIFAPAMLAFSSMLTEGAVGQYMKNIEDNLRTTQLASMQQRVSQPLKEILVAQGHQLHGKALIGITREEVMEAESALEALS